jgi:hypothetical protein
MIFLVRIAASIHTARDDAEIQRLQLSFKAILPTCTVSIQVRISLVSFRSFLHNHKKQQSLCFVCRGGIYFTVTTSTVSLPSYHR